MVVAFLFLRFWIKNLKLANPLVLTSQGLRLRQPIFLALSRGHVREGRISCAWNFDILDALGHRALKLVAAPNGSHCNLEAVGCSFPKGLCANHLEVLLR